MKTSSVLASLLFGSLAVAAPLQNKRDLVTKTQLVVETVVVYTTVWEGETPDAVEATSTPGAFYEQHSSKSSSPASQQAQPTSAAYTPPVVEPSSVYTPPASSAPVVTPIVTPAPTPTPTPVVEPSSVYTPAPVEPSSVVVTPSPVYTPAPVSTAAPAAPSSPAGGAPSGSSFSGDVTVYDNTGKPGACGQPLTDDMMIVALAQPAYGASTYDRATGNPTNPWCGKNITVELNGNPIQAQIMDMCPGCSGHDIDLSRAAFNKLTNTIGQSERYHDVKWWVNA